VTEAQIFGLLSALLLLAFGANRLFRVTRVPDLVILLITGLMLGPILKWVQPGQFRDFTQILGQLALILILFEGGLELKLREGIRNFPGGVVLSFVGYALSFFAVSAVAHYSLLIPWRSSFLLGGIFGCTSSTVVMPVLQQMTVREPVRVTLLLESALGDVMGVLTVSSLMQSSIDGLHVTGFLSDFVRDAAIAVGIGLACGLTWWKLWPKVAPQRFSSTVAFGVVLGIYSGTYAVHASGLLAVLTFGLVLGNMPKGVSHVQREDDFLSFSSELSFLVRSFFFVLLGVIVEFANARYVLPILAIVGAMLISRYLAVQVSRLALRGITSEERELIFLMMPRGLITAVLGVQVAQAEGSDFAFLPAMAFTGVLLTNLMLVVGSVRAGKHQSLLAEIVPAEQNALPVSEGAAETAGEAAGTPRI